MSGWGRPLEEVTEEVEKGLSRQKTASAVANGQKV